MLPKEFVDYAKKFEIAFLATIENGKPNIRIVEFEVSEMGIKIAGDSLPLGMACMVLANEFYSEKSETACIEGMLVNGAGGFELVPRKIMWTTQFSLEEFPKKIIHRWKA